MTPLFRRSRTRADDATEVPLAPYRMLAEPAPITALDTWPRLHEQYTHVVGWSLLGHGFLVNTETGEHAVLHPLADGLKSYGSFASTADFRAQVLDDEGFCDYVLQPWLVERVRARIGDPAENQVYMPVPYPFLGGSGEPETYDMGDVWVFWSIVGGMFLGD